MRHDATGVGIGLAFTKRDLIGFVIRLVEYGAFRINHRKSNYHIQLAPETPPLRPAAPAATSRPNP